ncbi:MAG: hypothetical protein D6B25_15240 [Desulfobulbaceae bacterium]|nr:MAG: hypothetical protein D6B25_15240 [Desulfobulbaceae bacterium]
MFFRTGFMLVLLFFLCSSLQAREIEGVEVPETISPDGVTLNLNGAGVRTKFIFDVYVASLYLQNKSNDVQAILGDDSRRRVVMDFLYSEVDKETLTETWTEGFEGNSTKEQFAQQQSNIDAFNQMFETVKEGDQIVLDYVPGTGTTVSIRGEQKGVVAGKEFNDLLLSIWLGKKPGDKDLKEELLGK